MTGVRFNLRSKQVSIHSLNINATFSAIAYGVWYGAYDRRACISKNESIGVPRCPVIRRRRSERTYR